MFDDRNLGMVEAKCEAGTVNQYIPPTKRQRLVQMKAQLETGLKKVNDALDALDKHPELEQFINIIENAGL